jgi:hypothetical protein
MTRPTDRKRWERWMNERPMEELRGKLLDKFLAYSNFAALLVDRFPDQQINLKLHIRLLQQLLSNRAEQN